jgi:ATP phosphoribosyltransferase
MTPPDDSTTLRLALPKGRMQLEVFTLLEAAGLKVRAGSREYRPTIASGRFNVKILKPQNIVEMLAAGSRDVGFAGADWVAELGVNVVEILDTGLDPVSLVAAAPDALLLDGALRRRSDLVIASEYPELTKQWIARTALDARQVRSYGATEVFPPDDADLIVDNTATGATLAANGLTIIDTLMTSSTRLFANPRVLDQPARRAALEDMTMLLRSVLEARQRVMLEVNVTSDQLEAVCAMLPCMREPTIARLHGDAGFAIKAAVLRSDLPRLVPLVKASGGTDLIVSALSQIVP